VYPPEARLRPPGLQVGSATGEFTKAGGYSHKFIDQQGKFSNSQSVSRTKAQLSRVGNSNTEWPSLQGFQM